MKRRWGISLLILAGCSASPLPVPDPENASGLECRRLPPDQWPACLERARQIDFNVYECERRALYGRRKN